MKLFNTWTQKLSFGIALTCMPYTAYGQMAYPEPMESGSMQVPSEYPSEMMAYDGAGAGGCDAGCDGYPGMSGGCYPGTGCGLMRGNLTGGRWGGGAHSQCGPGSRLTSGCGPLGCDGGTFGDGRSLSHLFAALSSRICSLTGMVITPYGEGGVASPRWFDLSAEAMMLSRSGGAGSRNFTSRGQNPQNASDFVLSSDQVPLDQFEAGLSLLGNIQVGPGSNIEVGYFGLNKWSDSATVTSAAPGTLFSLFSDFGTNPNNGFDDPDRSLAHTILYESSLHNGEVNLRRRWAEPSGFLQGSFLAGIRYFQLDESFSFLAAGTNNNTSDFSQPRFFRYRTDTKNQLTGFQLGADLWLNLIPGVKIGSELKGGIFGNHATQNTQIVANSLQGFQDENASDGKTAYLVQLSNQAIYRLTYHWTVRGSHQLIYVDNVALGPENVDDDPPALILPGASRNVRVNTDGELFLVGYTVGAEYTW